MVKCVDKDKLKHHMWIWYFLIFAIISWRYMFSFVIDTWSPQGILLINSMVIMMIIMGVVAIIFGITPKMKCDWKE